VRNRVNKFGNWTFFSGHPLVTDVIEHITANGIRTEKEELKLDKTVYATGFDIEGSICDYETTYGRKKHLT
jgi:cation diffusion facilitator CzcD-associated flavoprotein CzcO